MKLVHASDEPVDSQSPLGFALRYAAIGWHVFPIWPVSEGRCACGAPNCKSPAKHPISALAPQGQDSATTDVETIRRWWRKQPDANIGIFLAPSRLCAIDIDPRNGGIDTIEALEQQHGAIESDVVQITGGGGEHRIFQLPPSVQSLPGKLGPGVDVKLNGYIVAEPSAHVSGRRYAWEASSDPLEGAIASPLPDWLRDLAFKGASKQSEYVPPEASSVTDAEREELIEALAWISSDDRDTWIRIGLALHNDPGGQAGFDLWAEWSRQSDKFDASDLMRVWRSFKRRGMEGLVRTTVFALAQEAGWKNPGPRDESPADPPEGGLLLTLDELQARAQTVRWLVKHIIPAAAIGLLFGASGAFKSFVALDLALHVAHGLPWCGRKTKTGAVVYVAGEGGAGLWRRIDAWHRQRGLKRPDNFRVCIHPLLLDRPDQSKRLVEAVRETGLQPALVIVDTLSQTYSGDENDASEMAAFFRGTPTTLRNEFDASVLTVHHTGHSAAERPRGSSVLTANTDFVFGCKRSDDGAMQAVLECRKQKDGDRIESLPFTLKREVLGADEDGDEISSLVATFEDAIAEMVADKMSARTLQEELLMQSFGAAPELTEAILRAVFYESLGPDMATEAKKKAWQRSSQSLTQRGEIERTAAGVWARKGRKS